MPRSREWETRTNDRTSNPVKPSSISVAVPDSSVDVVISNGVINLSFRKR